MQSAYVDEIELASQCKHLCGELSPLGMAVIVTKSAVYSHKCGYANASYLLIDSISAQSTQRMVETS